VLGIDGEPFEHSHQRGKKARHPTTSPSTRLTGTGSWKVQGHRARATRAAVPATRGADGPPPCSPCFSRGTLTARSSHRPPRSIPTDPSARFHIVARSSATWAPDSGTGVAFTRDPGQRCSQGLYSDYLQNAHGETWSRASATRSRCKTMESSTGSFTQKYNPSLEIMQTLETPTTDLATSSSPSKRGEAWMLQTDRQAHRRGAFRIATQLVDRA